jgi:hypothetical protein
VKFERKEKKILHEGNSVHNINSHQDPHIYTHSAQSGAFFRKKAGERENTLGKTSTGWNEQKRKNPKWRNMIIYNYIPIINRITQIMTTMVEASSKARRTESHVIISERKLIIAMKV